MSRAALCLWNFAVSRVDDPRVNPAAPTEKLHRAICYALIRHEGQVRKFPSPDVKNAKVPYVAHPLRIMTTLALKLGVTDEATLCTAVLHDTIEDTSADFDEIEELFGREVAELVAVLTKDNRLPEKEREEKFLQQVSEAPLKGRLVKLCDNYDNLGDSMQSTVPAERRREMAKKKIPHVRSLAASMPAEYATFAAEVVARLEKCLAP